jgi:peroxisomal 3,2-trans-enoyl-CoA isomerase
VKNAFSDDLYLDLIDVMAEVAADSSLAVLIMTGTGSYFSSGADLTETSMLNGDGTDRNTLSIPPGRFMMSIITFPKILCAAVNGPAIGIGVTLLLHCDLCYCSETATLWAPFTRLALGELDLCTRQIRNLNDVVSNTGSVSFLVPELCSSATFIESMGLSKANELLLLGKKIDAKTALDWNICSQVVHGTNTEEPFHDNSLANYMAREVDERLLELPMGDRTGQLFVNLIRGQRQARMERVCRAELVQLDERFNEGEVLEASMQLGMFNKKERSKL